MLVEQRSALVKRHAQRVVLVAVPADGRLHDEASFCEQVEGAELACEQERVAERGDDRAGGKAEPCRDGGDRGEQHERARPRDRRILIPGQGIVAWVPHDPARPGGGPEDDVLADHDGVEAGLLGDRGHLDERAQFARRRQRPVLRQDEDEPRRAHRGMPATSAAARSTAARWCGSSSWPGTAARYANGSSIPAESPESVSITLRPQNGTCPAE